MAMEAISKNIIDVFIKMIQSLECPVCYEYVSSPIWQCEAGHILCNNCRHSIFSCPTCRRSFSTVRVRSLEQISDFMLFPCKNDGCDKILPLTDIQCHENMCTLANAFSRPDNHTRFTILQYNILKYIEHDIAPFLVTSHETNEQATQTNLKKRNLKDASTMTDSIPNVGNIFSPTKGLTTTLKTNPTATFKQSSRSPSCSLQVMRPKCVKQNTTVVNSSSDCSGRVFAIKNSILSHNGHIDKMFKKSEHLTNNKGKDSGNNLVTSEKLNNFLRVNDSKLTSKKGSTRYDCYLQSSSNKVVEVSTAPSGFNFTPFIKQAQSFFPTLSQDSSCDRSIKFGLNSEGCSSHFSGSGVLPEASTSSLEVESVFKFQATNEQTLKGTKATNGLTKSPKSTTAEYCKKLYNKNSSGFDFSALLKAPPVFTSDENRSNGPTNTLNSSFNTTTVSSCSAPSSSTQSIRRPVMSSVIFGDISYDDNMKGSLESVSHKVSSVFNSVKSNEQFVPKVTLPVLQDSVNTPPVFSFCIGRSSAETSSQTPSSSSNFTLPSYSNRNTQSSCFDSSSKQVNINCNLLGSTVDTQNSNFNLKECGINFHTVNKSNSDSSSPRTDSVINFKVDQQLDNNPFGMFSSPSTQDCVSNIRRGLSALRNRCNTDVTSNFNCSKSVTITPFLSQPSSTNNNNASNTDLSVRNYFSDSNAIPTNRSTANKFDLLPEGTSVAFSDPVSPSLKTKCEVSSAISGPLFASKIGSDEVRGTQSHLKSPTSNQILVSSQPIQNAPCLKFDLSTCKDLLDYLSNDFPTSSVHRNKTSTSTSLGNLCPSSKRDNNIFKFHEQSNTLSSPNFSMRPNDSKILAIQGSSMSLCSPGTPQKTESCLNSDFVVHERQLLGESSFFEPKPNLDSINSASANSPFPFFFSNVSSHGSTMTPSLVSPGTSSSIQERIIVPSIKVKRPDSTFSNQTMSCSVKTTNPTSVSVDDKPFHFGNPVLFSFGSSIKSSKEPVSSSCTNSHSLSVNPLFTFGTQSTNLWDTFGSSTSGSTKWQ